jgi:ABC-type branched-subunit amino acid transport system substrate-binding protein
MNRIKERMKDKTVPHADAAVAYDDIHEITIAANKCPDLNKECIREKLAETDYTGAAGHISFGGTHTAARPARVVQYKDGKWVEP